MAHTIQYTKEDVAGLIGVFDAERFLLNAFKEKETPMTPTHVCPRCAGAAGRYDFNAPDGVLITTWHCNECDRDVVPIRSEVVNPSSSAKR